MEIRKAVEPDSAAIGALHVASWRETYAGILPDEMLAGLSIDERAAMWGAVLKEPEAFGYPAVFVAEEGERIIGFASCGEQRDEGLAVAGYGGEIGAVYVLRSHQKMGTGRLLMAAAARALAERGHAAASLWVLRENAPARRFYEGLGGEVLAEKADEGLFEVAYGWRDLSRLISGR